MAKPRQRRPQPGRGGGADPCRACGVLIQQTQQADARVTEREEQEEGGADQREGTQKAEHEARKQDARHQQLHQPGREAQTPARGRLIRIAIAARAELGRAHEGTAKAEQGFHDGPGIHGADADAERHQQRDFEERSPEGESLNALRNDVERGRRQTCPAAACPVPPPAPVPPGR